MNLARSLDAAAVRYDAEHAGYPAALFDDLMALTSVAAGERSLEVGCCSGQATGGFLERGLAVTAIDPEPASIELARRRFEGSRDATFHVSILRGVAS